MKTIAPTALSPSDFTDVANLVRDDSAIVLDPSKSYLIESRLGPVARRHQFKSIAELIAAMRRSDGLAIRSEIVDAMTTNETSFFRDHHPFEMLRQKILPSLIEQRHREKRLTIWSNACSSGQEIYSIAMILREHFPELDQWDIRLWATDLSSEILDRAKAGIFNQTEVNRGLPPGLLAKYFHRDGSRWKIHSRLRSLIRFEKVNLIERWPVALKSVDVIFLRNVLIYFSTETKREILSKIRERICDDGCLLLGGSENIMNLTTEFEQVQLGRSICYRPI